MGRDEKRAPLKCLRGRLRSVVPIHGPWSRSIENFASKVEAWGLKKVQHCDYVFGSPTTFQRRKEWICERRCRQVSKEVFDYMFLRDFFFFALIKPFHAITTKVYTRSAFYPSLRFTLSLQSAFYTQSAFYPWSAVCSPQSVVCVLHWTTKKGLIQAFVQRL